MLLKVTDFLTTCAGVIFRVNTFSLQSIYFSDFIYNFSTVHATLHYLKIRVNVKVILNDDIANIRINSSYLVIQKRCLCSFQLNPFPLFIILTEPLRWELV